MVLIYDTLKFRVSNSSRYQGHLAPPKFYADGPGDEVENAQHIAHIIREKMIILDLNKQDFPLQ